MSTSLSGKKRVRKGTYGVNKALKTLARTAGNSSATSQASVSLNLSRSLASRPHGYVRLNPALKAAVSRAQNAKAETKFLLTTIDQAVVSTNQYFFALSNPPQNTTDQGRIGDQITATSLQFRVSPQIAGAGRSVLRFVVFQWAPDTGLVPPSSTQANGQPLQFTATSSPYMPLWNSPPSKENEQQYRIMYDQFYNMVSGTSSAQQVEELYLKSFPFGRVMTFTADNATTGSNQCYCTMLVRGSATGTANVTVNLRAYFKFNFKDQ